MTSRQLYIVAYDIACPRRLRRVLHVVRGWSTGGQRSVHECWLDAGERALLTAELAGVIERREDSVLILRVDRTRPVHTLGIAVPPRDAGWLYIG